MKQIIGKTGLSEKYRNDQTPNQLDLDFQNY